MRTNTPYLTALLVLGAITIIGNAGMSAAGTQPGHFFADTFLSSIDVECGSLVSWTACLDFMQAFRWPLRTFQVEGGVTFLAKPSLYLDEGTTSYVLFIDPGPGRSPRRSRRCRCRPRRWRDRSRRRSCSRTCR